MTVLDAAAVVEITALYARYAQHYDTGQAEAFAALFTTDGLFERGTEEVRGRAAIAVAARAGTAALPGIRHTITTIVVDPLPDDASAATGSAYVEAVTVEPGAIRFVTAGRYRDVFAVEDGRWRIREHRYEPATGPELRGAVVVAPTPHHRSEGTS